MMRPITGAAGAAAAVLLTVSMGAGPAGAEPVDRALADQLTQQYNQQELQQMEASGAGPFAPGPAPGGADRLNGQQIGPPGYPPPPPPPGWAYPPR